MRIAPDVIMPVHDCASAIERRPDLCHHRRTVRLPAMFVLPHPLHANRAPCERRGDYRGVGCSVVCAVVAVATGAFHMDAVYAVLWHAQHFSGRHAEWIDPVRSTPDSQRSVLGERNCTGWTDRSMDLVWPMVDCFDRSCAPD